MTRHTLNWYKENFGVSPLALGLPFIEKKNPHFSSGSPMKLWDEEAVLPFKSVEGIQKHQVRKEAGKKAHQTRKVNLIKWFESVKSDNPQVHHITHRLWEIGSRIGELHSLKANCRRESDNHFCAVCDSNTDMQNDLREERSALFADLVNICGKDKKTIKLARKYYREEAI